MRKIEFKVSDIFETFIDIGSCEKHHDFICLWNIGSGEEYSDWLIRFKQEPYGSKLIWLNYILLEFNTFDKRYFTEIYGDKISEIINNNLSVLNEFNKKWMWEDMPQFKGLDLNWEDIEDRILSEKTDSEGNRTEVELDEGTIRFLDEDDTIRSFYVKETEYLNFKEEVDNTFELFY